LIVVLGAGLGVLLGGCGGFIGQFVILAQGGRVPVSDAAALGMMCGGNTPGRTTQYSRTGRMS
jgi:hypothetical protein